MGINLTSNFSPKVPQFLDERQSVKTYAELQAMDTTNLPDGFQCYCEERDSVFIYYNSYPPEQEHRNGWKYINGGCNQHLTSDLTTNANIGYVEKGTTFAEYTQFEDILRAMFVPPELTDLVSYYGVVENTDSEVDAGTLWTEVINLNNAKIGGKMFTYTNNQGSKYGRLCYAYPTVCGELTSIEFNGLNYLNGSFTMTTLYGSEGDYYLYYMTSPTNLVYGDKFIFS